VAVTSSGILTVILHGSGFCGLFCHFNQYLPSVGAPYDLAARAGAVASYFRLIKSARLYDLPG
jgi:hypothetical protein